MYTAPKAGKTNISIVSISGQVSLRREVWLTEGMNYIPFNIGRLPAGIYTIVVTGLNGRQTQKIVH